MHAYDTVPPSTDRVLALVRGELSSKRRWVYRTILLLTAVWTGAILSLWITEPGSLPLHTHLSFAAMTAIGAGWIGILSYILMRRYCPTALDRTATAWMAAVACLLFLAVSVPVCLLRGPFEAVLGVSGVGLVFLGVALLILRHAYRVKRRLLAKRAELESTMNNE